LSFKFINKRNSIYYSERLRKACEQHDRCLQDADHGGQDVGAGLHHAFAHHGVLLELLRILELPDPLFESETLIFGFKVVHKEVGDRTLGYVTLPGRLFDDGIHPDVERLPLLLGVAESFGSGLVLTGKHRFSGQILATTYSRLYSKPTNKKISDMIDLSMEIDSMDRVTRPCANTSEQIKRCLSEINCKKIVLNISCTADDSKVDFAKNWTEERDLFRFVCNICSPGTDRKLKRIELLWISGNNTTSLAKRLTKSRSKMWDVERVIFSSGYIPKEEWEKLAQTFYAHFYADSKRDVMRAYQATLAMNISENATRYLQLFQKNKDNVIVPEQLRMAEMSIKKLSKKRKEEKSLELDNRMMSVHAKLPELTDSDWSKQSRKELQQPLTDGKITEDDCNREIANLDEPIYGSGKTTDTKCVAQIGNYMVIDSELNGDFMQL
jgi:hypothetical protein